jgi:iron-sulfur cluster assembly protein
MKKKTQEPTGSQEPTVEIVNLGLGYSFDRFFCPACGAAILEPSAPFEPECPHVEWAIFEGEFVFMDLPATVETQIKKLEKKRQKDGDDFDRFDELLKIWRGDTRMVFNITSEGMAGGPVRETLSVGLNFVPDVNMVTLTENAIKKIKDIVRQQDPPVDKLRIAVVKDPAAQAGAYSMAFENTVGMLDEVYKYDGFNVLIDPLSLLYLNGAEVDYVETAEVAGFKFNNPNSLEGSEFYDPKPNPEPEPQPERNPKSYVHSMPCGIPRPPLRINPADVLSKIHPGETVTFPYDNVRYKAIIQRINSTSATVRITRITGTPRRAISVGEKVYVRADILARGAPLKRRARH